MTYLIIILLCANDLFSLSPWELPVKPKDIGLVLICFGLAYQILSKRPNMALLSNAFTWLFLVYLLLVMTQVALAAINYDQSLLSGLSAVRQQFYYLSFFLFLFVLRTPEEIYNFMNILNVVALIVVVLAVVDYFGVKLFHSQFADEITIRSGIERAEIPAMSLISIVFLWNMARWSFPVEASSTRWSRMLAIVFLGAHFFRQSRVRLFSILVASLWQLVVRGKYTVLVGIGVVGLAAVLIASFTMETNLFLNPFVTGVEDVSEQTGTVVGRLAQLETDIEIFKEYPYFGGGTVALAPDDGSFSNIARKADLGYTHWLKHYGMLGIAWLLLFLLTLFLYTRKLQKVLPSKYRAIAAFSSSYLIFFTVSFVTLNHLMFRDSILLMCLYCAILVRATHPEFYNGSSTKSFANNSLASKQT